MKISRVFAMPNKRTFQIPPIREFVVRFGRKSDILIDPFAGDAWGEWNDTLDKLPSPLLEELMRHRPFGFQWATNDISVQCATSFHVGAVQFLNEIMNYPVMKMSIKRLFILDPPYSPTQLKRCYENARFKMTKEMGQNAKLLGKCKRLIEKMSKRGDVCLSFGWNSSGMPKKYEWEKVEILIVNHGALHNDTICVADRRR